VGAGGEASWPEDSSLPAWACRPDLPSANSFEIPIQRPWRIEVDLVQQNRPFYGGRHRTAERSRQGDQITFHERCFMIGASARKTIFAGFALVFIGAGGEGGRGWLRVTMAETNRESGIFLKLEGRGGISAFLLVGEQEIWRAFMGCFRWRETGRLRPFWGATTPGICDETPRRVSRS
jgi:hypothetical protein